jgi:serine protease Do
MIKMPAEFNLTRKTILGLVAAGLVASTMMTASVLVTTPVQAAMEVAVDPTKSFAPLAEHVMPSVVSVQVKFAPAKADESPRTNDLPPQLKDFFEKHPEFRDRFSDRGPNQERGGAVGSGFVVSSDGYVITNNHVVQNASEVTVTFQGDVEYDATVIGTDPKTDLALLKIKSDKSFPFVNLAEKEGKVGDWVMAVGNPFGLGGSVTAGIISARGRDIGSGPYDDFLQIDASINKGNSGGPTFNLEGDVVGVNTAIYSPSGGSVGIGFAIPASIVKDVVESLKSNGSVTRGWLGVQIQPVTDELAEGLGLAKAMGAIISDVTEDSPALKAGLKQGDTILKANGEDIDDARDLARTIAKVKPESKIDVDIIRDGKAQTIAVTIGTMPGQPAKMAGITGADRGFDLSNLGLSAVPADDGAGMKVTSVDPKSDAAERGVKPGDIIIEIAGKEVASASDVAKALQDEKSKRVLLLLRSGDNQRFIALSRDQG